MGENIEILKLLGEGMKYLPNNFFVEFFVLDLEYNYLGKNNMKRIWEGMVEYILDHLKSLGLYLGKINNLVVGRKFWEFVEVGRRD